MSSISRLFPENLESTPSPCKKAASYTSPIHSSKRKFSPSFACKQLDFSSPAKPTNSDSPYKKRLNGSVVDRITQTYKDHLYYHGTTRSAAKDIEKHGMSLSRKKEGALVLLHDAYGFDDPLASKHHYVMSRANAAEYAKMREEPRLVRLILPSEIFTLEVDPEAGPEREEYRVFKNIADHFVLPRHQKDLKTDQLKKINKEFNFPELSKENLKSLKEKVRSEILEESHSDALFIENAKSFLEQEEERSKKTLQNLSSLGVDLSHLKEGETFSLPMDYTENDSRIGF